MMPSDEELYAPLTEQQIKAALDAIDQAQRPWYLRLLDYPCFVVLALGQVIRRRWDERGGGK